MNMDGRTEWFGDASNFRIRDGNIVHHGNPQGTRENVSYYPRANGFSFDTLNITHLANGGRPPPPPAPGSSSFSSSDGFHPGGARPRNPRSATHDSRSTCQGWIEDYGKDDTPHAAHRPGANPLQGQGQYPRTAPFRGMSTPSSYPSGNHFYGSYDSGSTLPTIPIQPAGTSAAGVRQDIPTNLGLRDDQVEEVQSDPDDDWEMSDDEEVEEPEPQAGYMMNNVFIPRLLEWLATQHPSYPPTRTELLAIWEEYVPGIPPHGGLQTHIITSAGDRINAWRDGFRDQALVYLERHVRPSFEKDDSETRRRWAQTMKPSGRKRPPYPFYFRDPEKRTGSLLSDFIAFTLSSHFKSISAIPLAQRSPMFPLGALALSLQACECVLDVWGTGAHHPDGYPLRGSAFPEHVWQLVTTQLGDRALKQKRILEATQQQLERLGRSIVP